MTALAASYEAGRKVGELVAYPVAANAHIYKGALVCVSTTTGLIAPATDAAGVVFVGVAYEEADNTGGAAGAMAIRVLKTGTFAYAKAGASLPDIGQTAYVVDDNTVSVAATAHSVACGVIVAIESAAIARVRIDTAAR